MVVFHPQQLKISEHKDLFRHIADVVIREIHPGNGHALPPILAIEGKFINLEQVSGDFANFLPDVVEGARLEGPLDNIDDRLFLYHFKLISFNRI